MNDDMYKIVIMDHYKYPHNKIDSIEEGYFVKEGYNPSCGDRVSVLLKVVDEKLELKFMGNGCSICCSSASVMTLELKGLTISEAINKIDIFKDLITKGDIEDIDIFEDGRVFSGITRFPSRFKCAFLSWDTTKLILEEINE